MTPRLLLPLAFALAFAGAAAARPVETETIIVPEGRAPAGIEVPLPPDEAGLPEVQYDPAALPAPVRRLREQLMEVARSGDIEGLRPILEGNGGEPDFGFEPGDDPVENMKALSADGEGAEVLAILLEVLEAGFVHVDRGTSEEMYVWPYFARYPASALTPKQMVELFKILTGGDYADMLDAGGYMFYRAGIAPDGTWRYFVAGQ